MALVRIRGSLMPHTGLPKGKERTVPYSPWVQNLIDRGHVDVIAWIEDDPKPAPPKRGRPRKVKTADLPEAQPGDLLPQATVTVEKLDGTKSGPYKGRTAYRKEPDGGGGVGSGQPDAVHVAAEGGTEGGSLDAADQTTST